MTAFNPQKAAMRRKCGLLAPAFRSLRSRTRGVAGLCHAFVVTFILWNPAASVFSCSKKATDPKVGGLVRPVVADVSDQ